MEGAVSLLTVLFSSYNFRNAALMRSISPSCWIPIQSRKNESREVRGCEAESRVLSSMRARPSISLCCTNSPWCCCIPSACIQAKTSVHKLIRIYFSLFILLILFFFFSASLPCSFQPLASLTVVCDNTSSVDLDRDRLITFDTPICSEKNIEKGGDGVMRSEGKVW